jgi:CHAT domain-containing protein
MPPLSRWPAGPVAVAALLCVGGGLECAGEMSVDGTSPPRGLVGEIARTSPARTVGARLSVATTYQRCPTHVPPDGTIAQARCPGAWGERAPSAAALDVALRASAAVHAGVDADGMHAAALIDLLWLSGDGKSLVRSISYLQTAARLSDRPAPVLVDLAAAYITRAETDQDPRNLLDAIEATDRALQLDPGNEAARFNAALARDRLGLDGQAARAWSAFLAADSLSDWAKEARQRLSAIRAVIDVPPPRAADASTAALAAYAARAPQEARFAGWDTLLGQWGTAVLQGDSARAADLLRRAAALGRALAVRGGDASLDDAVTAIQGSAGQTTPLRLLAGAHRDYAAGRAAFVHGDFELAGRSFRGALRAGERSKPLHAWAMLFQGGALLHAGHGDPAERIIRRIVAVTDTVRYPALAAHARWAQGLALGRRGRYEQGLALVRAAESMFARAGEREHVGTMQFLAADAEYALGDAPTLHTSMHRALTTLRGLPPSMPRHQLLCVWAQAAADGGYLRASVPIQDEDVAVALATGSPEFLAEALLARARLLIAAGDTGTAMHDIETAAPLIDRLPPGSARGWIRADFRLAEAGVSLGSDPRHAVTALDSVVAFFSAMRNPGRLLPALVARAEARLTTGQTAAGEADLERAVTLLDRGRELIESAPRRATLLDAARRTVDRIVLLRVAAGRPVEALAYLERGRVSLAPVRARPHRRRSRGNAAAGRAVAGPRTQVVLEYALVGDTLLTWTVADTTIRLTRTTVERTQLMRAVARAQSALELRSDDDAARADLAALYDWLIRPTDARLRPAGVPLTVIADGEIAAVPFAALYDSTRARYLVEDHVLRFASSLRDVEELPSGPRPGAPAALLVADPAFDARVFPVLERLPGALAEVQAISPSYPGAAVLSGAAADLETVTAALTRAAVVHYAGHAVFDDDQPEQSYLVLGAPGGERVDTRLSATALGRLDLRAVRLVVLSACQTARAQSGRSGGFAGLAGALLAAGAGGVVGSLWRVDDQLTRALMVEFHRVYLARGDAAEALRAAQLHALRSSDAAQRSPGAWAAFRYAGH